MNPTDEGEWMLEEHERIRELSARLRSEVGVLQRDREQWIASVRDHIDEFARHLHEHMAAEEQGGYLAQVVERRPTLSGAVDILRHEHVELGGILADLQRTIQAIKPTESLAIRHFCVRVEHFLSLVERHEEHENHIVLYTFTQDMGTHD